MINKTELEKTNILAHKSQAIAVDLFLFTHYALFTKGMSRFFQYGFSVNSRLNLLDSDNLMMISKKKTVEKLEKNSNTDHAVWKKKKWEAFRFAESIVVDDDFILLKS